MLNTSLEFRQRLKRPGEKRRIIGILRAKYAFIAFMTEDVDFEYILSENLDSRSDWSDGRLVGLRIAGSSLVRKE